MTEAHTNSRRRIYFLDNLKSLVIFLVIVHHSSMAYMEKPVAGWGIVDVRRSFVFDIFAAWNDAYIMPLMFFISGYFGVASLEKRSVIEFMKGKWFRIGWPWLTGIIFLAPLTTGVAHFEQIESVKSFLIGFWTTHFSAQQYWYLNVLLWFYLTLLIAAKLFPTLFARKEKPVQPGIPFFVALLFLAFFMPFALNLFVPDGQWSPFKILEIQWVRSPLYLLFFFCGTMGWKNRWFERDGYFPNWKKWVTAVTAVTLMYICLRYALKEGRINIPDGMPYIFADTSIRAVLSVVCGFSGIAVFCRFADITGKWWKMMSLCAFPVYWIQQPVVTVFSKLISTAEISCYIKFLIVAAATTAVSFVISKYLLVSLPFFSAGKKAASVTKNEEK